MMMSIALRFIPTLIEETDKIMSAQKARGADFETGSLIQKAKALIPLLVPLFISAFRRADELAVAMECRCYHGGEGRTRLRQLKYKLADYVTLLLFLAITVAVGVLGRFGLVTPILPLDVTPIQRDNRYHWSRPGKPPKRCSKRSYRS